MSREFESRYAESDQGESAMDRLDSTGLERRIKDAQPVSDHVGPIANVQLDRINPTDIQSADDFKSPEQYAGMRHEAARLGQIQPALEQGANADTFDKWDKANQIGHYSPDRYVRGYVDAYRSYYGDEPIALDPKPDGTYDVINGRHRIVAAREAGLKSIPARVLG